MPSKDTDASISRVLVLGAYGLIGSAVARRLKQDGFDVVGLGRSRATARTVLPDIEWIVRDFGDLVEATAWDSVLARVDAVVNCAGALQDGGRDDLRVVHEVAVTVLARACRVYDIALVQISAVGAHAEASTRFMRSKWAGDTAIREAGIRSWIFRPGLVLGPTAYGGSLLLRTLAAVPLVQPMAYPDAKVQTLSLHDLTTVISAALAGEVPAGTECDLVEDHEHGFRDLVATVRQWLGFPPARLETLAPAWMISVIGWGADMLGRLGWRAPLRRSALTALSEGVRGDPEPFRKLGLFKLSSLDETLSEMPASAEDRLHARLALLLPFILATLFLLWFVSGVIGLWRMEDAAEILTDRGWPNGLAIAGVVFWSLVDIAVAAALLVRKYAGAACLAMVFVGLLYVVFATFFAPGLWLDPLSPLVKILPGILLALVARATLETR